MKPMRAWAVLVVGALVGASACSDDDTDEGTGGSAGSTGGSAGATGGSAGSTGGSAGSTGGSAGAAGQGCGGAGASDCVDPCSGQFYSPSCVDGGWTCTGPIVCDGGNDA